MHNIGTSVNSVDCYSVRIVFSIAFKSVHDTVCKVCVAQAKICEPTECAVAMCTVCDIVSV